MDARVRTFRTLHFFDAAGVVVNPALLTGEVLDPGDNVIETLVLTQNAVDPNLFLSTAAVFTQPATLTVNWYYNAVLQLSEQLVIGFDPSTDFLLNEPGDVRFPFAAAETFTAKIIDGDGIQVGATEAAVYNAATLSYELVGYTFAKEDDFFVVWFQEIAAVPTPIATQHYLILVPRNQFDVRFVVATADGSTIHEAATLLISETDGTPVATVVTDVDGKAGLTLNPGDYIVTLAKTGFVFNKNNIPIEIRDPLLDPSGNNVFHIQTDRFAPTFSLPVPPANMATLFLNLIGLDGSPIPNAIVLVALVDPPTVLAANIVWDTTRTYCTNASGYVDFQVVQGSLIEVSITPLSLRRRFTVPSGNDALNPINLATLLSGADDPFDILQVKTTTAVRRNF